MNEPGKFWEGVIFYPTAILACLILALFPFVSWVKAGRDNAVVETPLRWCVVTQMPVAKGVKIKDEDVGWAVKRLGRNDDFIADKSRVIGRYALTSLDEGEVFKTGHFSESAPTKTPIDGATIPVEVKTEHAGSLKPGMRLAFVREKERPALMIPGVKKLTGKRKADGFEVISITISSKDASITTLTIAVEKKDMASVRDLANGQWRPVILR